MSSTTHTMRAQIELRKRILNGDIEGGTHLFEVPLAEMLRISRTPVREALSRLAEEGLLDRKRAGGYAVRRFGLDDVIDWIEIRAVLEGTAARLAAERGVDEAKLRAVRAILTELDGCFGERLVDVDIEGYLELNMDFHKALSQLPGSAVLEREIDRAYKLPFASPSGLIPDKARVEAFRKLLVLGQEQHHGIVDAIVGREGSRAEAMIREHARTSRRSLEHIFERDERSVARMPGIGLIVD
ncbi:GntR family transcriptional regulator [Oricola sp.]|uniref:GntR family transcriptional regulator n=1 Tax=Oricola sp. TaxID=1979950 RepID=UPI003BAAD9D9